MDKYCTKQKKLFRITGLLCVAIASLILLMAFSACTPSNKSLPANSYESTIASTSFSNASQNATLSTSTSIYSTTTAQAIRISFALGAYLRVRGSKYKTQRGLSAKIIMARADLEKEFPPEPDDPQSPQVLKTVAKYSDDYFKDFAIVLIMKGNESGSIRDQYTALKKLGSQLIIEYTKWIPNPMSADIGDWRVLLEVKRADVNEIVTINEQQSIMTLPSGVPIPASSDFP